MKKIAFFIVAALLTLSGHGWAADPPRAATADIINAQGTRIGKATFTPTAGGLRVSVYVNNLAPGLHGCHVHAVGKADPPDFKSSGPHFNPMGTKHGIKNPQGAHAGDLPNIMITPDGIGQLEAVMNGVTLEPGTMSLFQPEGTSIVIHAAPDDDKTDPSGNSGARIAAGVITR